MTQNASMFAALKTIRLTITRRFILLCGLSIAISTLTSAQSRTDIGIRSGYQFSSAFITHSLFPVNLRTDFIQNGHFGVVVKHFNFRRVTGKGVHAGLQLSANYIQRGWRQTFSLGSPLPPLDTRLSYLEIPVEAILYGGSGRTKFFGTLGIYFERLVSSDVPDSPDDELLGRDDFFTYQPDRDPENGYGIRASLGSFVDLPFGTVQLELFTSVSFSGVFEFGNRSPRPPDEVIPDQSVLYSVGLSAGYFISFGKLEF